MIAKSKPKRALTLARNCGQNEWLGLVVGICKGNKDTEGQNLSHATLVVPVRCHCAANCG